MYVDIPLRYGYTVPKRSEESTFSRTMLLGIQPNESYEDGLPPGSLQTIPGILRAFFRLLAVLAMPACCSLALPDCRPEVLLIFAPA